MKRYLILIAVIVFSISLSAQESRSISLNLTGGYALKDKVNIDALYGYFDQAFQYGAGLEYFASRNKSFELRWSGMGTNLPLYGPTGTQLNIGKDEGTVNYILAGGNTYFGDANGKAMPYLGAGLGVGIVSIKEGGSGTKFAWDAKLGVKVKTSSSVSINLQAYVQSIISAAGYDTYYYPGWGYVTFTDYASLFQFGLSGAICFNFKKK